MPRSPANVSSPEARRESSPEISDKTVHVLEVTPMSDTHTFSLVGAEVLEEDGSKQAKCECMFLCPKYVRTNRRPRRFFRGGDSS